MGEDFCIYVSGDADSHSSVHVHSHDIQEDRQNVNLTIQKVH